jgi:signal transduction histidine kinase
MTNLVTNAAKYGAAPYSISSREVYGDVVVRVTDSGPGVSKAFEARLFDRYTRSDDARAGEEKGTGLGLYIAQSLMSANGGEIRFERPLGGGAAFTVALPTVQLDVDETVECPSVALANG